MTTVYPGAIDALTNPASGDTQDTPSHAGQHSTANDAIEAIETALGINPQGDYDDVAMAIDREIDYVEFTSSVAPTATTEATANTVVTGNAIAYDGSTVVMIEFFCPNGRSGASASQTMNIWLYDGSSSIGSIGFLSAASGGGVRTPVYCFRRLTPSAATHTYSIRASVSAGTGALDVGAGGAATTMPGFIRITRK